MMRSDFLLNNLKEIILFLVAIVWTSSLTANEEPILIEDTEQVFAPEYISVEMAKNFPVSFSLNRFDPGELHPVLGYRYRFKRDWIMGVGAQFRILEKRPVPRNENSSGTLAIWTLYHEVNYAFRLNHPNYLLFGPHLSYMLPCRAAVFPLGRDDLFHSEIGVGLSLQFVHLLSNRHMLTARAERWRGTGTMRFHSLEVAWGFSYAL